MVRNVHTRVLNTSLPEGGLLIDSLASEDDRLWPVSCWPPMKLDRPLGVGASGGHGPIGYVVEEYRKGEYIRFRFSRPSAFIGIHAFDLEELEPEKVRIRHVIDMRVKGLYWFIWHFGIRCLHDALIEDAFDCAEKNIMCRPVPQRKWSAWVRFLRWMMRR